MLAGSCARLSAGAGGGAPAGKRHAALTVCCGRALSAALLQKYLDNYELSIRVVYVLGTLGFSIGAALMAVFANVYIAMVMISTMGVVSMSISYCPYALLGQYHDIKEVRPRPWARRAGPGHKAAGRTPRQGASSACLAPKLGSSSTRF